MTTPLHAALGEPGAALTFDIVARAAAARVEESEQLDWKAGLHLQPQDGAPVDDTPLRLELAKDIAAMANTRGGLLVCGVRESTTGPHTIRGLGDLSDGVARRKIVQVAFTHIYPPVSVDLITLVSDAGETVLVISVPESDDAPHLVRPKGDKREEGWMVAPVRAGRETRNMVEKELESAYQRRFAGRRTRERELRQGLLELAERRTLAPPANDPGTLVAFARPMRPRSGPLPSLDPARWAGELVSGAAWKAEMVVRELVSHGRAPDSRQFAVLELMKEVRQVRRSLRRHVGECLAGPETERGLAAEISVELHDDGSVHHRGSTSRNSVHEVGLDREHPFGGQGSNVFGDVGPVDQPAATAGGAGGEVFDQLVACGWVGDDVGRGDDAFDLTPDVRRVPGRAS